MHSLAENKLNIIEAFDYTLYLMDISRCISSSFIPLYKSLHFSMQPASFLLLQMPIKYTRLLAQLRLSSSKVLYLNFNSIMYVIDQNLTCTLCNTLQPENLFHLLFDCPVYAEVRVQFPDLLLPRTDNFAKLLSLLESHGVKVIKLFWNYIFSILKVRSFLMNE